MLGGKKQLTESSGSMDGESIGELSAVFDAALLAEQTTPNSATQSPPQQKELKRFHNQGTAHIGHSKQKQGIIRRAMQPAMASATSSGDNALETGGEGQ
eukprot:scaffold64008_cov58-Attheya_sp.AAC.1